MAQRGSQLANLLGELQGCLGVDADVVVARLATPEEVEQVVRRVDEHGGLTWPINGAGVGVSAASPRSIWSTAC